MEQIDILAELEEEIILEPATPGQRFANFIVDIVGMYATIFVVAIVLGSFIVASTVSSTSYGGQSTAASDLVLYVISFIVTVLYFSLMEGLSKGRSLGKLITRTRAVKEDGSPITFKDAFVRALCRCIPFEPFSMFSGSPWHDSISRTKVVKI
ncbi:RDD family protein [Filimonas effusa]|uniref:RDD family protein n=1 Tax=Filimonas effusa TaxID=2508721 RepID=A0A4Q1DAQ4_9BACT|nr:RDD family protein [Filimonas effusa]RXK86340.1 RDD family protein [Filimonas effusa]